MAGCGSAQPTLAAAENEPAAPAASLELSHVESPSRSLAVEPESEPEVRAQVEEPPPPVPFEGQPHVTVQELLDELELVAQQLEGDEDVRRDYEAFVESFELTDRPELFADYVRVKLAFEATRDGGFWNLRWAITNEKPNSEKIWAQWGKLGDDVSEGATATAECDELSALFAYVVRGLGVDRVGLFWPQWNHVVAVWTIESPDRDTPVRVVVPTSQIFLSSDATLGTLGFNPWKQKTIYTYKRRDVRKTHRVPTPLAQFFIQQARSYAHRPQSELQQLRNQRSNRLGGS